LRSPGYAFAIDLDILSRNALYLLIRGSVGIHLSHGTSFEISRNRESGVASPGFEPTQGLEQVALSGSPRDASQRARLPANDKQGSRNGGFREVVNVRHRAKHLRHHTKDEQRFVLSVIAYDSLPGHQSCHRHSARVGLGQGGKAHANLEMDRVACLEARRDDDAADGLAQLQARTLGTSDRYRPALSVYVACLSSSVVTVFAADTETSQHARSVPLSPAFSITIVDMRSCCLQGDHEAACLA
jgi:hypothetical protein